MTLMAATPPDIWIGQLPKTMSELWLSILAFRYAPPGVLMDSLESYIALGLAGLFATMTPKQGPSYNVGCQKIRYARPS